jgi:hemerythrin superfamily protein
MSDIPAIATLILEQHMTIRQLFAGVEDAAPAERTAAFEPLVRLLAVHETAEEEIVYPAISARSDAGRRIADARKREEDAAKKALADLEEMDASSAEFMSAFARFRTDVEAHAASEEAEVLPLLQETDPQQQRLMGTAFAAAEAMAPTHAHRAAPESAIGNMLVGPYVAMVDRVRDAIRDATKS